MIGITVGEKPEAQNQVEAQEDHDKSVDESGFHGKFLS
jgi:hypothetical protein